MGDLSELQAAIDRLHQRQDDQAQGAGWTAYPDGKNVCAIQFASNGVCVQGSLNRDHAERLIKEIRAIFPAEAT